VLSLPELPLPEPPPPETYQSYEQGIRKPSIETLILMFIVLEIPYIHFKKIID
jgi:hypothetical protein